MAEPALVRMNMREREALERWAVERASRGENFSASLLRAVHDNDELFELSALARPGQFGARVLLCSVHYLLLKDPGEDLAAYYPTITPTPLPPENVGPVLVEFCRRHRDTLAEMTRTRTLQTTFVERSVQILYAMDVVARAIGSPFSIVEVGCSAGLLLLFDRYRYEFSNGARVGAADAEVVVSNFKFTGAQPRVPAIPKIANRVGLDLFPIDLRDADARIWALACVSPDKGEMFRNLKAAFDYRARSELDIVAGDAMQTLPAVLERIEGPVCVYHSRCLYQWPIEAQSAFSAMLLALSRGRTIHRIGIERSNVQKIGDDVTGGGRNEISHTVYKNGAVETRVLGRVGDTIEWLG